MISCGYHCSAKPVSFGKGQSAVHTAAYNSRSKLHQEREGRSTRDYGRHEGKVLFSGIFAPAGAPGWVHNRNELWNRAEAAERQINGQPARNIIAAFPHELNQRQRVWMLTDFCREQFARRGMIVDASIHAPDEGGDQRNYHVHLLATMRRLDGDNFAKTKCREWNSKAQLNTWREDWAEKGAKALERAGYPVEAERWRHGHRTLAEQYKAAVERGDGEFAGGLDREATWHKGPKVTGLERRNEPSDRLDELREVIVRNEIRVEIKALDRELAELDEEQKRTGVYQGPDWTHKGGMVEQQHSAMKDLRKRVFNGPQAAVPSAEIDLGKRPEARGDGLRTAPLESLRKRIAKGIKSPPSDLDAEHGKKARRRKIDKASRQKDDPDKGPEGGGSR